MTEHSIRARDTIIGIWVQDYLKEVYAEDVAYLEMMGKWAEYVETVAQIAVDDLSNSAKRGIDELVAKEMAQDQAKKYIENTISHIA